MKEVRGGDKKWKNEHLPIDPTGTFSKKQIENMFNTSVVPLAIAKTGALLPWAKPSVTDIQAMVDCT
jgi:hypothetical protein